MSPRSRSAAPGQPAAVLLISPDPDDHRVLPQILDDSNWRWHAGSGCRQALELLRSTRFALVICECRQPDGCWQDLLAACEKLASPPHLIVCSPLADDYLWAEVLNLGGYDVLIKPFDHEEVSRVACSAWDSWIRRGRAVRKASGAAA